MMNAIFQGWFRCYHRVRGWVILLGAVLLGILWAFAPMLLARHVTATAAQAIESYLPTTNTSTATPTPANALARSPYGPDTTPVPIYIDSVEGRFFFNLANHSIFDVGTATPPVFTEQFAVIYFDPHDGGTLGCTTTVNEQMRPFTDVMPGTPGTTCATKVAQDGSPTPTYQAGYCQQGSCELGNFFALYTGYIEIPPGVPVPVDITFSIYQDDSYRLGIGPSANGDQPYFVSGDFAPSPPSTATPWPTTAFFSYPIVSRREQYNDFRYKNTVVRFPSTGYYPFELNYAESALGGLSMTLGSTADNPVPPGESPTPTNTPTYTPTNTPTSTPIPTVECLPWSSWCTSISPNTGSSNNELRAVVVIAQDDIWAVGGSNIVSGIGKSLVEHWNNTAWAISTVPDVGILNGLAALSRNNVWAVGAGGPSGNMLHWDGSRWQAVVSPYSALAVVAVSPDEVWAVGRGHIQKWNGTSWNDDYDVDGTLTGIAYSSNELWAVGFSGQAPNRRTLIMHRQLGRWSLVTGAALDVDSFFDSVDLFTSKNVWAVGSYYQANPPEHAGYRTLVEHYDGISWRVVSSPNPTEAYNELHGVWYNGEGDVWAVGEYSDIPNPTLYDVEPLLLHWDETQWDQLDVPSIGTGSRLEAIGTIPGSSSVVTSTWAVGCFIDDSGFDDYSRTLIEHLTAPALPVHTTSYYETSLSVDEHAAQGCQAAQKGEGGIIVLDYGHPRLWTDPPGYGTQLLGTDIHAYTSNPTPTGLDITKAVESFAKSYHNAYAHPVPGCQAFGQPKDISIAIGLSDYERDGLAELDGSHAQAWATMVATVKAYTGGFTEISIASAIDAEPNWWNPNDPPAQRDLLHYQRTYDWIKAYGNTGASYNYNFGSTDGYPKLPAGTPTPVVPPPWGLSGWDAEQLFQVSQGVRNTQALPEIYRPSMARDWYRVKHYGFEAYGTLMYISGDMSECASSRQPPDNNCHQVHTPDNFDFGQEQAWQVFWEELRADPPPVNQWLSSSTDIQCSNGLNSPCRP